ncbi:hypothetical protein OPT61_g4593 [Boeremia exigua]|uniref:Uncharacterized protein n=1 Tax=Boeremia exigua TaxID=749465 RepID=A0ACC2IDJ2_9PLEO|nr:hypothetical protein OPT61_g4593 [Boeremia exigua]
MSLLSLPLELLQQIATWVQTAHRPSLNSFSLTSKACQRATAFLTFQRIVLTINDCKTLRSSVDDLIKALTHTDSASHVQHLTLKGMLLYNNRKTVAVNRSAEWWRQSGLNEILEDEVLIHHSGSYVVYDEPVIKKASEEDQAWAPVLELLQVIPNLNDLVYDCQNQFPPSVLSILHTQHPRCRLHHLTFKFRTLLWGVPYPYEMELATSPCLYRVKVLHAPIDTDGDDDYNMNAVIELAAGLAPNLKEVAILNLYATGSWHYHHIRAPWKGLPGYPSRFLKSLTSLSLNGFPYPVWKSCLQSWAQHIDFTWLRHLTLAGGYENRDSALSGETMRWISQNFVFPRLKSLRVYLTRDDMFLEQIHYSDDAVCFFRAFEPLEELSIDGPVDPTILGAILSRHGQQLRKLCINPSEELVDVSNGRQRRDIPMEFSKERVLQIQLQCPVIEELAITIKRNQSSTSEAELYKCFSNMKHLRFLFLTLDCSELRVLRDPTYQRHFVEDEDRVLLAEFENNLSVGEWKNILINCAVDEALARSIWQTISHSKQGRRLERLKLWTTGGGKHDGGLSPCHLHTMLQDLSRSWLIERVPRDDEEKLIVRELGQRAREADDQNVKHSLDSEAGKIFRTIWPSKEGSKDWRDDWTSFLLPS